MFFINNEARRLKRGDEVIVPAVSWSTTYFPLQQYGLKVKFVDVDRETLNIDLKKLKTAITDKTKVILAVNLLGNPNDFDEINSLIGERNIALLEDNCESMGAMYNGQFSGTFGVMGSFSCFYSHHISTMEGGVVVTNNEDLFHIMRSLRSHGWNRGSPDSGLFEARRKNDPFAGAFDFVLPGYNVRPLEISGAIGIQQLKKL